MSATDELRRLLDERGVEYTVIPDNGYSREHIKIKSVEIWTNDCDEIAVFYLTPEQAVEATLGSDLKAENAELRELVRDTLRRYYRPFLAEDADRQLARRAEELGVEV